MIDDAPQSASIRRLPRVRAAVTQWNAPANGAAFGGDWCDVIDIGGDVIAITIGDVAGHGEAASGTMRLLRATILPAMRAVLEPARVLTRANGVACAVANGTIVTAIVAYLHLRRRTLTFANAGHPPPLVLDAAGHTFVMPAQADLPLGIFPRHAARDIVRPLAPDALMVLYTDGCTEFTHDIIAGERALIVACRTIYERADRATATRIAEHLFRCERGDDDAALVAVRTSRGVNTITMDATRDVTRLRLRASHPPALRFPESRLR